MTNEEIDAIAAEIVRILPRHASMVAQPRDGEKVELLPVNITVSERVFSVLLADLCLDARRKTVILDRVEQHLTAGDMAAAANEIVRLREFERNSFESQV